MAHAARLFRIRIKADAHVVRGTRATAAVRVLWTEDSTRSDLVRAVVRVRR